MKKILATLLAVIVIVTGITFGFNDIQSSVWYSDVVARVSAMGIMNGYNGNFRPDDNVTRAELAATIVRTVEYMEKDYESRLSNEIDAIVSKISATVYITSNEDTTFGSGVFIDETGRILTAYHVVKGNDRVTIMTAGGSSFEAGVLSYDENSDLALLQAYTDGRTFDYVKISNDYPNVLDRVYAIGNPFGLRNTISVGTVSSERLNNMQMDISINSGNSGGAILNTDGELVGIALSIIDPEIGSGIGFSAKLSQIKEFVNSYK